MGVAKAVPTFYYGLQDGPALQSVEQTAIERLWTRILVMIFGGSSEKCVAADDSLGADFAAEVSRYAFATLKSLRALVERSIEHQLDEQQLLLRC